MQRYSETVNIIKDVDGKRRYETMLYPDFPRKTSDIYIISKQLSRMDILAQQYYNDPRFWWIIHKANNLPGGTLQIPAGTRIRIPYPLSDQEIRSLLKDKQF